MIKLRARQEMDCARGRIFYNTKEKGFDTLPDVKSDIALLIAYVNIGFDSDNMCVNQVFGLSPSYSWIKQKLLEPPNVVKCALELAEDFDSGIWRLDRGNEWRTYFDIDSGWVCIGNPKMVDGTTNVQFIDHAIAILNAYGELQALWMHPIVLNDMPLTF